MTGEREVHDRGKTRRGTKMTAQTRLKLGVRSVGRASSVDGTTPDKVDDQFQGSSFSRGSCGDRLNVTLHESA